MARRDRGVRGRRRRTRATRSQDHRPLCRPGLPPALAYHLKLPTGSGLVVDWVAPASPAEAAGLKLYDVVTQIDDQRLVNPEQLRTLVRLRKPGDPATFTVIRQGQPTTVTLKLTQTEVDEFAATTAGIPPLFNVQPRRRPGRSCPPSPRRP